MFFIASLGVYALQGKRSKFPRSEGGTLESPIGASLSIRSLPLTSRGTVRAKHPGGLSFEHFSFTQSA